LLHLSSYLCVVARSVVNIQHSIGCLVHGLVVFSWYDVITCESSVHTFICFFYTICLFLTFLNIHIYFIILKTYDQQFTLTTKKSLHIIFKTYLNVNFRPTVWPQYTNVTDRQTRQDRQDDGPIA